MKKVFSFALDFLIVCAFFAFTVIMCGLIAGCSPTLTLPTQPVASADTTVQVTPRTVTDTILLAAEQVTVYDSFPCPPGLVRDSLVTVTFTRILPGRQVVVTRTVHDTLRQVTKPTPGITALPALPTGNNWPERLTWLLVVAALLAAQWATWKKKQPVPA